MYIFDIYIIHYIYTLVNTILKLFCFFQHSSQSEVTTDKGCGTVKGL